MKRTLGILFLLAAGVAVADTVDQGAPGNQGPWDAADTARMALGSGETLCPVAPAAPVAIGVLTNRKSLLIRNIGPNPIYLGPSSVTVATGMPLDNTMPAVGVDVTSSSTVKIYCIAAVATQLVGAGTRYLEIK